MPLVDTKFESEQHPNCSLQYTGENSEGYITTLGSQASTHRRKTQSCKVVQRVPWQVSMAASFVRYRIVLWSN